MLSGEKFSSNFMWRKVTGQVGEAKGTAGAAAALGAAGGGPAGGETCEALFERDWGAQPMQAAAANQAARAGTV